MSRSVFSLKPKPYMLILLLKIQLKIHFENQGLFQLVPKVPLYALRSR